MGGQKKSMKMKKHGWIKEPGNTVAQVNLKTPIPPQIPVPPPTLKAPDIIETPMHNFGSSSIILSFLKTQYDYIKSLFSYLKK